MINKSIKPGADWFDDMGKPIHAHGASMFYENDTFYWYGENKEKSHPGSGIWHWGVRCYSSKDLYNWHDEGLIIPPDLENENSSLHPSSYMDRPHIIYNMSTKKYVCWIKNSGKDEGKHYFTILTANELLGPYVIEKQKYCPNHTVIGDFDLAVDETTGKAYLYAETDVCRMTSYTLTGDYLDVEKEDYRHFENRYREGITHFSRNEVHYVLTSGRTGYIPNPSEIAKADTWHGPYEIMGNPFVDDVDEASFNSQVSCIFKHPKVEDLYILMADRWVPDFKVTKGISAKIWGIIVSLFKKEPVSKDELKWFEALPMLETADTTKSRYVWLPIRFDGEQVCIDWLDEWKVEEYNLKGESYEI